MTKAYRPTLCHHCGSASVICIDSRQERTWRMRRRVCSTCHRRWKTYEVPAEIVDGMDEFLIQAERMRAVATEMADMLQMFGARVAPAYPTTTGGAQHELTSETTTNQ